MPEYLNNNVAMDWNDTLENDGQEYVILPEGDYVFTVTSFERGHFPGSAKMSPCNKATLTLQVLSNKGIVSIRTDFILNRLVEFRISAFYRSVGLKKHGEKLVMDWDRAVGLSGRAHFKPRTYLDNNGNEHQVNNVERFYDYDASKMPVLNEGFMEVPEGFEDGIPFN